MASNYITLPAVSLGSITLGAVTIDAGTAHIGSVTLDTEAGATAATTPSRAVLVGGNNPVDSKMYAITVSSTGAVFISGSGVTGSAVPTTAVMAAGTDGTNLKAVAVDTSGNQKVIGTATAGSAIPSALVPVAGSDGTNARALLVSSTGQLAIGGSGLTGSAVPTAALMVGGTDGTNLRAMKTKTDGRQILAGVDSTGSAVPAEGMMVAGTDGTNLRALLTTSTGQLAIAGAGLTGSAVPTSGLMAAGTDGTNLRALKTDTSGQLILGQSTAYIGITSGQHLLVNTSFTRPADTTAYTAKDVISNSTSSPTIMTFSGAGLQNGGSGYIVKVRLCTNQSTFTGTIRLWLYHTTITMINDNSPFTLLYTNKDKRIACLDLTVAGTEGSGSDSVEACYSGPPLAYKCASGDTALYGILETISAFTPASGQGFFVELELDQNKGA